MSWEKDCIWRKAILKVCYFSLFSIKRIMEGHNKACVLRKELHVVNYFKIYEFFLYTVYTFVLKIEDIFLGDNF